MVSCNCERAEYLAFPRVSPAVILITESELMAVLVGVTQKLILIQAPGKTIGPIKQFVLQTVDRVLRPEIVRSEHAGLHYRIYSRRIQIGQIDITL